MWRIAMLGKNKPQYLDDEDEDDDDPLSWEEALGVWN